MRFLKIKLTRNNTKMNWNKTRRVEKRGEEKLWLEVPNGTLRNDNVLMTVMLWRMVTICKERGEMKREEKVSKCWRLILPWGHLWIEDILWYLVWSLWTIFSGFSSNFWCFVVPVPLCLFHCAFDEWVAVGPLHWRLGMFSLSGFFSLFWLYVFSLVRLCLYCLCVCVSVCLFMYVSSYASVSVRLSFDRFALTARENEREN